MEVKIGKISRKMITDIVQDPDFQSLLSSGEFVEIQLPNGAAYQGSGVYKSNDYGLTWSQVDNSNDNNLVSVIDLDFISHLAIDMLLLQMASGP